MKWNTISMGDIALRKGGSVDPKKHQDEVFELYSIPAFDSGAPEVVAGSAIGSSKKAVRPNDVMISRIVPHIRRACVVGPADGHRQIASGEWIIFRDKHIWPKYLRWLLVGDVFYSAFMRTVSGVGGSLLRARPAEVFKIQIPLPPLDEQKRIARILDAADTLRARRREALAELDTLLQSIFLDVFGDPVTNPMGWVETPFGDIATDTKLGLVRSSKEFGWDLGIPYVRMNAVTSNGHFLPDEVQSTHADEEEADVFALRPGDFLFNTRNSKELVGKVCVFPGPEGWLFNNNLMRVRFRAEVEPWVIAMQFRFRRVQRELEKRKSGTTSVFAVYWKSLRTLPVLVPPSDLQHRFAAIVESVEHQKASQRAHLAQLDTLFASLQSRAFRGDL